MAGISLTLDQWKSLVQFIPAINAELKAQGASLGLEDEETNEEPKKKEGADSKEEDSD